MVYSRVTPSLTAEWPFSPPFVTYGPSWKGRACGIVGEKAGAARATSGLPGGKRRSKGEFTRLLRNYHISRSKGPRCTDREYRVKGIVGHSRDAARRAWLCWLFSLHACQDVRAVFITGRLHIPLLMCALVEPTGCFTGGYF